MSRIQQEKKTVERMIRLYCRKKEGHVSLCPECTDLIKYTHERLEHCPFGEQKTACKSCRIHCYKPEMRERIRTVMRFSGPRMLFYHPWAALQHLFAR